MKEDYGKIRGLDKIRHVYIKFILYLQNIFSPCLTESDEGISAISTRHRSGFNQMVEDALAGRIEIKLAYLIQRERAEYRGNRRNKGIWRYWIASDAFFFLWVL